MRKKHQLYQSPTVRIQPLPKNNSNPNVHTTNIQVQKDQFLKHRKTPDFVVEGDTSVVEDLASRHYGRIRFDLLGEAEHILGLVKEKYGLGEAYLDHIYGPRIEQDEANEILFDYIKENSLQESLSVYWSNDLTCSARMMWRGYTSKCNKPEARRYSLWLNGTNENPYLRENGLVCLLDHEIGTHFYRSYNDGFQPWYADRKRFGLRSTGSFESLCSEEGLAAINTTLRAKEQYMWLSALVYYTACKSTEMTFKELFDHLGKFLQSPEQRWKHVMRVKRGLVDPNDLGGYGKDQCYFEGAVSILRNLDDINFNLLMSGKICYDECGRVKRLARLGCVKLPAMMKDMSAYRKQLKKMAYINGLNLSHPTHQPSLAYLTRLREREAGIVRRRKVRRKRKLRGKHSRHSDTDVSQAVVEIPIFGPRSSLTARNSPNSATCTSTEPKSEANINTERKFPPQMFLPMLPGMATGGMMQRNGLGSCPGSLFRFGADNACKTAAAVGQRNVLGSCPGSLFSFGADNAYKMAAAVGQSYRGSAMFRTVFSATAAPCRGVYELCYMKLPCIGDSQVEKSSFPLQNTREGELYGTNNSSARLCHSSCSITQSVQLDDLGDVEVSLSGILCPKISFPEA